MPTTYRYLFVDLSSNAIIGELPLTGEQVVRPMNDEEFAQYQIDLAQVTTQ